MQTRTNATADAQLSAAPIEPGASGSTAREFIRVPDVEKVFGIKRGHAVARDDKAADYLETFRLIRSVIPAGDDAPALGIVTHTRKPKSDEKASGRGLLNTLAGSYALGSVPRCVFVMQAASGDIQKLTDEVIASSAYSLKGKIIGIMMAGSKSREISATETRIEFGSGIYAILPTPIARKVMSLAAPRACFYIAIKEIKSPTDIVVTVYGNHVEKNIRGQQVFSLVERGDAMN